MSHDKTNRTKITLGQALVTLASPAAWESVTARRCSRKRPQANLTHSNLIQLSGPRQFLQLREVRPVRGKAHHISGAISRRHRQVNYLKSSHSLKS